MSELDLVTVVHAPPSQVWDTWMDARKMEGLTGSVATIEPRVGGAYELWEGSVRGEFVYLRRPDVIVCTWRTEDFDYSDNDSRLEMSLRAIPAGTQVRVVQDRIPHKLKNQFVMAWNEVLFPAMARKITGVTLR